MRMISYIYEYLKKIGWIRRLVRSMGITSGSDWLFNKDFILWMTKPYYKKQLPISYKLFFVYCEIFGRLFKGKRIIFSRQIFWLASNIQKIIKTQTSFCIQFDEYAAYLDLHDPLFLAIGYELNEKDIMDKLSMFVHEGDTFIDVGANQGVYSVIASSLVGKSGMVVSVEPQPQLINNIEKSMVKNAFCKFQTLQMAVGNHNGEIDLIIPINYSGIAGIYTEHSGTYRYRSLKVPIRKFDEAVKWEDFHGSVFLKLDIEGSEYAFLLGAEKMMRALKPMLLIEINSSSLKASNTSLKDIVEFLLNVGYSQYRLLNDLNVIYSLDTLQIYEMRDVLIS